MSDAAAAYSLPRPSAGAFAPAINSLAPMSRRTAQSRQQGARLLSGSQGYGGTGSFVGASSLNGFSGWDSSSGRFGSYGGQTALSRSYSDVLMGDWALGIPKSRSPSGPLNLHSWAPPPEVVRAATQPAELGGDATSGSTTPVSLATLVSNQLAARRKVHLAAGWDAFRNGDYQAACAKFSLADGYSSAIPAERFEARVPLLYGRVATYQYAEAIACLKWMLEASTTHDLEAESPFPSLVPDLPSRYGRRSELDTHLDELGKFVSRSDLAYGAALNDPQARGELPRLNLALTEAKALQLVVLYAVPEQRSRVLFDANSFANAPQPWTKLAKFLQSNRLGQDHDLDQPRAKAGGSGAGNFPFNLFPELPPQDIASQTPPVP